MSPDPLTLEELRKISNAKIFELTRVSESTINRWKAGNYEVPFATQQLLKFFVSGIVPNGFGSWTGAQFRGDHIYPMGCGMGYSSGEVKGFYLTENRAQQVPGLEREVVKLLKELNFHKQQTMENAKLGFMRGMVEVLSET